MHDAVDEFRCEICSTKKKQKIGCSVFTVIADLSERQNIGDTCSQRR